MSSRANFLPPTLALILLEMVFWAGSRSTAELCDSKGKRPLLAFVSEESAAGLFRNEKGNKTKDNWLQFSSQ